MLSSIHASLTGKDYYGKLIGDLMTKSHQVSGKVYAASEMAFYLVDFTYDGQGTSRCELDKRGKSSLLAAGKVLEEVHGTRINTSELF